MFGLLIFSTFILMMLMGASGAGLMELEREAYFLKASRTGLMTCENCGAPEQGDRCAYCRKVR
jgi:hypothetical protein